MSDCNYTVYPPLDYGAMAVTDVDKSFIMDCTANMTARADTISSIGTATIIRDDGETLTSQDLTVISSSVVAGGLKFTWGLQGNGNAAKYIVSFPMNLTSGTIINRSIVIRVLPAIG